MIIEWWVRIRIDDVLGVRYANMGPYNSYNKARKYVDGQGHHEGIRFFIESIKIGEAQEPSVSKPIAPKSRKRDDSELFG